MDTQLRTGFVASHPNYQESPGDELYTNLVQFYDSKRILSDITRRDVRDEDFKNLKMSESMELSRRYFRYKEELNIRDSSFPAESSYEIHQQHNLARWFLESLNSNFANLLLTIRDAETHKAKFNAAMDRWRENAPVGAVPFPNAYDVSGYPRSLSAAYERANIFLANEIDFHRHAIHADTTNSTFATIRPGRRDKTKGDALRPGNKIHGWEKEVTHKTTGVTKKDQEHDIVRQTHRLWL